MENENIVPELQEAILDTTDIVVETVVEQPVVETLPEIVEPVIEEKVKKKGSLVTIHSPKKVFMAGVGTLQIGENVVTKEEADKWLAAKYYVTLVKGNNK